MFLRMFEINQLHTLGETLVGKSDLTREKIEAETAEDTAEGWDGDEAVGSTCLEERKDQIKAMQSVWRSGGLRFGEI